RARPALPRAREARPTGCPAMRPRGRALGRKTEPGPRDGPASPATYSPQCGVRGSPSNGERAAAAAAARGVRVLEREAGTHHGGDVVDLHAIQVLAAERIHEEPEPVGLDDVVVLLGLVLDVQAILEARATTRQHGHTQSGRLSRALLLHELPHLGNRRRCDRGVHRSPPEKTLLRPAFGHGSQYTSRIRRFHL